MWRVFNQLIYILIKGRRGKGPISFPQHQKVIKIDPDRGAEDGLRCGGQGGFPKSWIEALTFLLMKLLPRLSKE